MSDNPFDDLVPSQQTTTSSVSTSDNTNISNGNENPFSDITPQQQGTLPQQSVTMDFISAFNRQFDRMAEGGIQAVAKLIGSKSLEDKVAAVHAAKEAEYNKAWENSPTAATIGSLLGTVGSAFSLPIPAVGSGASLGTKIAARGATGAALGGMGYVDNESDRLKNAALGAALNIGAGALVDKLTTSPIEKDSSLLNKVVSGKNAATNDMSIGLQADDLAKATQTQQVADDIGVKLTPSELTQNPTLGAVEKSASLSKTQRAQVYNEVVKPRDEKLQKVVLDEVKSVLPNGVDDSSATVAKMYEKLNTQAVPDSKLQEILQNPIIKSTLDDINKTPGELMQGVADNSFQKLAQVKVNIDHMLKLGKKGGLDLSDLDSRELMNARDKLLTMLDTSLPEYKVARNLAEKNFFVKDVTEKLQTIRGTTDAQGATLDQVFSKLLPTPEAQKELISKITKFGGDGKKMGKVFNLINTIRKSPINKIADRISNSGGVLPVDKYGIIDSIKGLVEGKYNDTILDMMLNSKSWKSSIDPILTKRGQAKQSAGLLKLLLERGSASTADKSPSSSSDK